MTLETLERKGGGFRVFEIGTTVFVVLVETLGVVGEELLSFVGWERGVRYAPLSPVHSGYGDEMVLYLRLKQKKNNSRCLFLHMQRNSAQFRSVGPDNAGLRVRFSHLTADTRGACDRKRECVCFITGVIILGAITPMGVRQTGLKLLCIFLRGGNVLVLFGFRRMPL